MTESSGIFYKVAFWLLLLSFIAATCSFVFIFYNFAELKLSHSKELKLMSDAIEELSKKSMMDLSETNYILLGEPQLIRNVPTKTYTETFFENYFTCNSFILNSIIKFFCVYFYRLKFYIFCFITLVTCLDIIENYDNFFVGSRNSFCQYIYDHSNGYISEDIMNNISFKFEDLIYNLYFYALSFLGILMCKINGFPSSIQTNLTSLHDSNQNPIEENKYKFKFPIHELLWDIYVQCVKTYMPTTTIYNASNTPELETRLTNVSSKSDDIKFPPRGIYSCCFDLKTNTPKGEKDSNFISFVPNVSLAESVKTYIRKLESYRCIFLNTPNSSDGVLVLTIF